MGRSAAADVPRPRDLLKQLLELGLLGLLVGIACWPFNLVDRWQDRLLHLLPVYSGEAWGVASLALACSPVLVVPLLLLLQRGPLAAGAGSGIPQTMTSLEQPEQAERLLGPAASLQRLLLWSLASLSLMPLGREGPVVQVGAAVGHALRRRFPGWLGQLSHADLVAVAAGAGLAGGFDTPLLGVVFVVEEFISSFSSVLIWPALVIGGMAAAFSNLAGQPEFALGTLGVEPMELMQVVWAVPIGVLGGLLGGLFGRLLLRFTRLCLDLSRRYPLRLGLVVGGLLALFMLLSGGASGGDGEALMQRLIDQGALSSSLFVDLLNLLLRLLGPVLALGTGIPGGLIDPAFAYGAVAGHLAGSLLAGPQLGLALGMAAGLAGATQLPVMAVLFAVRMAGDQQLLPGLLLAAVLAAYASRLLVDQPIYHALKAVAEAGPFRTDRR